MHGRGRPAFFDVIARLAADAPQAVVVARHGSHLPSHVRFLDADDVLERILVDGHPDPDRFGAVVGAVFDRYQGEMRAFSELGDILVAGGNVLGGAAVDDLWGALIDARGDAISRAIAELQRRTRTLEVRERAHDALAVLQDITSGLAAARTEAQVLDVVAERGLLALGSHNGSIYLVSKDGASLELARAVGPPGMFADRRTIALDAPLPLAASATEGLVIFEPAHEAAERWADLRDLEQSDSARFIASLPLVVNGRSIGAMGVSFVDDRAPDDDERAFFVALAHQCAQALDRARLNEETAAMAAEHERLYKSAREADRRKDEFLALLGHELRNPLAPILTALQLLETRSTGGERERRIIERQVRHLTRLVDDLLDVSRITKKGVHLQLDVITVADVIERALELASPVVEARAHALTVDLERGLTLIGDASRLTQVFSNIIANAAQYSDPRGRIEVRARAVDGLIEVTVKDRGAGIEPELLSRVFDPFTQGSRGIDRRAGGLGLGLAIAKNLVEAHGGTIDAFSEGKGKGTLLTVRLPTTPPPDADNNSAADLVKKKPPPSPETGGGAPAIAAGTNGKKVLVVDDNVDVAELIGEGMRELGHDVRVAFDAPAALVIAAEFKPAVALLDIGLPVMDGYELARRLREAGHTTKLVALTGYGQEDDRERTKAAGFDVHLVKPVDLDQLAKVVE